MFRSAILTLSHLKIDRVRSAQPDHRLDMKMLLLLTQET